MTVLTIISIHKSDELTNQERRKGNFVQRRVTNLLAKSN